MTLQNKASDKPVSDGWTLITILMFSFGILLLFMPRDLNIFDEGIVLSDAMRVLSGEIVHRDFYSSYSPGQYYAVAALFALFGKSFMVARLYDLLIRSAILTTLFYILRKQVSLIVAGTFTMMAGLWFLSVDAYLSPVWVCILLLLVSSHLVTRFVEKAQALSLLIGAGVLTGITALFRYDTGFFVLAAHISAISIFLFSSVPKNTRLRRFLFAVMAYGVGTSIVFLPPAIWFLIHAPVSTFYADIVTYSVKYYAPMRGLPLPHIGALLHDLSAFGVYLPVLAVGVSFIQLLWLLVQRIRAAKTASPLEYSIIMPLITFGSVSGIIFLNGIVRISTAHMMMAIIPSFVVLAILVSFWWGKSQLWRFVSVGVLLLCCVPVADAVKHEMLSDIRITDRSIVGWLALRSGVIKHPHGVELCEAMNLPRFSGHI